MIQKFLADSIHESSWRLALILVVLRSVLLDKNIQAGRSCQSLSSNDSQLFADFDESSHSPVNFLL